MQPCCARKIRLGLTTVNTLKVMLVSLYNTYPLTKSRERALIVSSYCLGLLRSAIARTHSGRAQIWARAKKLDEAGSDWASSPHHPRLRRFFALTSFGVSPSPTKRLLRRLLQFLCLWFNDTFSPVYNVKYSLEWQDMLNSVTAVDCTWHYYNRSAAMGWVFGEKIWFYVL